jgi:ABC-type nitrate/sulfonate/bicarbonate transport system permease component
MTLLPAIHSLRLDFHLIVSDSLLRMPTVHSRPRRVRVKKRRQDKNLFQVRRSFWDLRIASSRKIALFGFLIGGALGCLLGATLGLLPSSAGNREPDILSVNQATGKPQLHIKGKPEIK